MRIAFVLFEGLTALDLVGLYDPLTRLRSMGFMPDLEWDFCARTRQVRDDRGLRLSATRVGEPLTGYDLVVVPGGFGTRPLRNDAAFLDWLRTAEEAPLKASVCTGALIYGAAGFLQGRRATTHPSAYELLRPYCAEVVRDSRVVDEGPVVTARGVTAALDLGLHLVRRLAGAEAAARMRIQMDYPYGA
jgi:transcriptional regulator GlxA family with amidase domain